MAYKKRSMTMGATGGGTSRVTQRVARGKVGYLAVHTHENWAYNPRGGLGKKSPTHTTFTGGRTATPYTATINHTHAKRVGYAAGGVAAVAGGLYVGHKWHQHSVRKNAERHYNTKVAR